MNKQTTIEPGNPLAKLREPFPAHQINKLPKPYKKDSPKGNCSVCGRYHGLPATHLDYVGHAALTDRLLDTDIKWSWEPVGFTPEGLPALDLYHGLWIKLTICGVTRYGYGAADGKAGGDAMKEIIGDALRNAAMRFGAALDLWHKGDLHAESDDSNSASGNGASTQPRQQAERPQTATSEQIDELKALLPNAKLPDGTTKKWLSAAQVESFDQMPFDAMARCIEHTKKVAQKKTAPEQVPAETAATTNE